MLRAGKLLRCSAWIIRCWPDVTYKDHLSALIERKVDMSNTTTRYGTPMFRAKTDRFAWKNICFQLSFLPRSRNFSGPIPQAPNLRRETVAHSYRSARTLHRVRHTMSTVHSPIGRMRALCFLLLKKDYKAARGAHKQQQPHAWGDGGGTTWRRFTS